MNVRHAPGKVCGYSEPCNCAAEAAEEFEDRATSALGRFLEAEHPGVEVLDWADAEADGETITLDVTIEDVSRRLRVDDELGVFSGFSAAVVREESGGVYTVQITARD